MSRPCARPLRWGIIQCQCGSVRYRHGRHVKSITVEVQVRPEYAIPTTPQHYIYPCQLSSAWPAWLWLPANITTTFNNRPPTNHLQQYGFRGACGSGSRITMACRVLCVAPLLLRRRPALSGGNNKQHQTTQSHATLDLPVVGTAATWLRFHGVCGSDGKAFMRVLRTTRLAMRRQPLSSPGDIFRRLSTYRHLTPLDMVVCRAYIVARWRAYALSAAQTGTLRRIAS